jgi:uncharacterized protein YidB (DUF937 family)
MGLLDIVGGMLGGQQGQQGQSGGQDGSAALIAAVIGMLASGAARGGSMSSGMSGGMSGGLGDALGSALGGGGAQGGAQGGGLGALLERFQAAGMGDIANSWVSSGQNMPLSSDQFSQVLGQQQVSDLASRFGLSTGDLSAQMSQALPQVVDRLTPDGRLPEGDFGGLGDLLGMLTRR